MMHPGLFIFVTYREVELELSSCSSGDCLDSCSGTVERDIKSTESVRDMAATG